MKKIIKNGLVFIIIIGLGFNANAIEGNSIETTTIVANEGTTVTVKNQNGKVIISEQLTTSEDLSNSAILGHLSDGIYTLELDNGLEIEITPFVVEDASIDWRSNKKESVYKPIIQFDGKHVLFSRLSLTKEPMVIRVYNKRNRIVFTETIKNQIESQRVYDFSKMDDNNYKMIINSNDRIFYKTINLK